MGPGKEFRAIQGDPEEDYDLRLMAFLQRLVREHGRMETAGLLGIDSRTLASSLSRGRLSERVRDALELMMLSSEYPAATGLEERMETLAKEMSQALEKIRGAVAEEREQRQALEKRVARLELRPILSPQPQLGIATREPLPGEEAVLDPLMPFVAEWRKRNSKLRGRLKDPAISREWEQYRELEIVMISDHGLTLGRDKYAGQWSETEKRDQLAWRVEELAELRRRRKRRERVCSILRVLTLGRLGCST